MALVPGDVMDGDSSSGNANLVGYDDYDQESAFLFAPYIHLLVKELGPPQEQTLFNLLK